LEVHYGVSIASPKAISWTWKWTSWVKSVNGSDLGVWWFWGSGSGSGFGSGFESNLGSFKGSSLAEPGNALAR